MTVSKIKAESTDPENGALADTINTEVEAESAEEMMVDVFIPPDPSVDEDKETHMFVGVNGRTFMLERGMTHTVPKCVADVIQYSFEAKSEADKYRKRVLEQMNAKK